jgi:hypothetical protein
MFQLKSQLVALCVSAFAVACGGDKAAVTTGADTNGDGDSGAAIGQDGLPLCGTDPAKQPDKCVDDQGAVRCKSNSGYPGDELALCAPDPEKGQLIHFGPSDYTNPDELAKYMLKAGDEQEFCLRVNTTNTDAKYFAAYHGRMRPHSHHLIVTMPNVHTADETTPKICSPQIIDRWLFGAQTPQIDVEHLSGAATPDPSDPDYGLAHDIPAQQTLMMDLHYVNVTESDLLREAWATLDYVKPEDVKTKVDLIGFYNPHISIPPMGHFTTPRQTCSLPTDASGTQLPVYLGLTTGHAHRRLQRLSLYHNKPDGSVDLIYETKQWSEPGQAEFVKGVTNPPLPVGGAGWGAVSGYLQVLPGETVSLECEYQNDLNTTVTFGDTTKDEMCNVFGFYYPSTDGKMWNCL